MHNTTPVIWKFIASRLMTHVIAAIVCIGIVNLLLNQFWLPIYMTYHLSPIPGGAAMFQIDLQQYNSMSDDILIKNHASLIVLNDDLQVIYSINSDKTCGYQYSNDALNQLLLQKQKDYILRAEKIETPQGDSQIVLLKIDSSFIDVIEQSAHNYSLFVIGCNGIIILLACISFIRSIYKPLQNNLNHINQVIQKTPHDTSPADISQASFMETKLVLQTYNTMLNKMEEIQQQKEESENKSHRLIANLSHDLKSPMTSIRGYAELLEQENLTSAEQTHYLSHIHNNITALNSMVELLSEQVKYQYHDYHLQLEEKDMNAFLREICANYYTIFDQHGFVMDIDIAEEPFLMFFDCTNMRRVYSNLLDNILSHNPEPAQVQIRTANSKEAYLVQIKDNGIGIEQTNKDKIFEPFYQGDLSRTHQHSGLGLFVVKQILEKHNASITLEQEPAYKTVFTIRFHTKEQYPKSLEP